MKVIALMSTYNGERFLQPQIDSIICQKDVEISVLVRDDGSTDSTMSLLESYVKQGASLLPYSGANLGPARSFMQLLADAPLSDYYCFADQDDYWNPEKSSVAVSALETYTHQNIPALYFCQTQLADEQLSPLPSVIINPLLTLGESLVYQFIGGCTMVMNEAMRKIVLQYTPKRLFMHDVWVYCIAQSVGAKIVFDSTPHMLYRQHSNNVVGQGFSKFTALKRRFNRVFGGSHVRSVIAKELIEGYASAMPEENRQMVAMMANYDQSMKSRFQLAFDKRFVCSNKKTYRLFQMAVLAGSL